MIVGVCESSLSAHEILVIAILSTENCIHTHIYRIMAAITVITEIISYDKYQYDYLIVELTKFN